MHLVFVTPYVFLSLSDAWRAFDRRYEAIAAGLGKGRWTVLFSVRLPLLSRAVLTAFAVGFAVSIGLYLPTVLIGAGRIVTITTEAVALASSGDRRIIGVYAFLQMLLPLAGFAIATLVPALLWRKRRACAADRKERLLNGADDRDLVLDGVAISLAGRELLSISGASNPARCSP